MKSTKYLQLLVLIAATGFFASKAQAQDGIPSEVASIVGMSLEEGQTKLGSLGYEICASSLFAKKEDWVNESTESCVTVMFKKKGKEITEVKDNPAMAECLKGLEASRAVWDKYHDGPAPVSSEKIDAERKKLTDSGFKVSYWIDEIAPGRSSEYWVNETDQKAKFIVWDIEGTKWVKTDNTDYEYGTNPAPPKN